jgi:hypothetical protein
MALFKEAHGGLFQLISIPVVHHVLVILLRRLIWQLRRIGVIV